MLLYYRKELFELSEEIFTIHEESEGEYQDVMYIWTSRAEMLVKLQGVLYFFNAVGFCLFPLYGYFVLHEKTVIYDLLLPFDTATKNGYSITIAIQIFLIYGSTIGIFVVDLMFLLMIFSGAACIDLLGCDCKILTKKIEESMKNNLFVKDANKSEFHELLLNAVKRSQDITLFVFN